MLQVQGNDAAGRPYAKPIWQPAVLIGAGSIHLAAQIHQQMVCAVEMGTYHHFRLALGRDIS